MKIACASRDLTYAPFSASLESKNGVPAKSYMFQIVKASMSGGSFTDKKCNNKCNEKSNRQDNRYDYQAPSTGVPLLAKLTVHCAATR